MGTYQTTYNEAFAKAVPGLIADTETFNTISRTLADSSLAPGKAVFRSGDHKCTGTASALGLGIAVVNPGQPAAASNPDNYLQNDTVAIITQGVVWVTAGEDVTAGAAVYVTGAGAIVDTSGGNTALTGWVFDEAAASGALVRIAKR